MIGLVPARDGPLSILCVGAHSDDLEIGAFGTVSTLLAKHPGSGVCWLVLSGDPRRRDEARRSAEEMLQDVDRPQLIQHAFRDGYFPYQGAEVKDALEEVARAFSPDVIVTHALEDRHQDHRLVAELTWNTWRDQLILEYEIPKFEGNTTRANVFVPLERPLVERKLDHLDRHFLSQHGKDWYDRELFRAVMRVHGMECRAPSGFAEGFVSRKAVIG